MANLFKEHVMYARDGLIAVVTLVLALAATAGVSCTTSVPRGVQAEAAGFDALAHALFGGLGAKRQDGAVQ
jgi:hypothetical protein